MTINECILCRGGNNIKRKDTLFAVLRQLFCCCWSAHEIPTKLLLFQYLQLLHCICWMFFTSRSVLLQFVARDCNLDLFKILEKRLNETFSRQNCYKCFVHKFFFSHFFVPFFVWYSNCRLIFLPIVFVWSKSNIYAKKYIFVSIERHQANTSR